MWLSGEASPGKWGRRTGLLVCHVNLQNLAPARICTGGVRDARHPSWERLPVLGEELLPEALGDNGRLLLSREHVSPKSEPFLVGSYGVEESAIGGTVWKHRRW